MKFNLTPASVQKQYRYDRLCKKAKPLLFFFMLAALCLAIYGTVLAAQARKEIGYYEQYGKPIQHKIHERNEQHKKILAQAKVVEQRSRQIPWASILVALADTRPDVVQVESVEAKQSHLVVSGKVAAGRDVQEWQSHLRQAKLFTTISVSNLGTVTNGGRPFSLHVEIGDAISR